MSKVTPMIEQYLRVKEQHRDAILFYRMGDFYEMFFEDAVVAARELEITLTSRDKQAEDPVPMCGVPHHAADTYIGRLLDKGYRVAVCDQVEDPREAKGLVRREVVRVVTPGTSLGSLDGKSPNYLAATCSDGDSWGLAFLDLSTGDFRMTQMDGMPRLLEELGRVEARELLVPQDPDRTENWWRQRVSAAAVQMMTGDSFGLSKAERCLLDQFQVVSLEGFGIRAMPLAVRAAGAILDYVQRTQFQKAEHIRKIVPYRRSDYLIVDEVTTRHLELLRSSYGGGRKGTLLDLLDLTVTAVGARLLRHWVLYPLLQPHEINQRQDAIACLREHEAIRAQVRHELVKVYDLERLTGRVTMGSANPRDLGALRRSLESLPRLKHLLGHLEDGVISRLGDRLDPLGDVARILQEALVDNPPLNLTEGGVIRDGYNGELDRLLTLSWDAKKWIARLEAEERQKTGIASLKVGYNRVFGYYLEVSKANVGLVPDRYVRKQTLVNAERYITEELREYETQVVTAEERRIRLEEDLFRQLRLQVADEGHRIQASAAVVAELDVLAALAEVANRRDYCRPAVDDGPTISIEEGRHPTVEASVPRGTYVPNDIHLDNESRQMIIITGPNMSGKSTILRQVALILLMAQMGMPVPA
ncbi:MAG TPA: DNA mismatch repair protein MutS, partial [Syntrophobacteria bacterium]|nr:DNA mismatch repair protein MutS [Syntrophobacteria bacterium]